MSSSIICSEDKKGSISCYIPKQMDEVTFQVDEIASGSDIIEGHMDSSCLIEFDGPTLNVCQVSLESAL